MNQELNGTISLGHPSIVEFVTTIRKIGPNNKWIQHDRISKKKERAPVREPVLFSVIPANFIHRNSKFC